MAPMCQGENWCGHCGHGTHAGKPCHSDGCRCEQYINNKLYAIFLAARTCQLLETIVKQTGGALPGEPLIMKPGDFRG